jgi:hypothetical protein
MASVDLFWRKILLHDRWWLICSEEKVLLTDCWWLVCSERKVLLLVTDKPNEHAVDCPPPPRLGQAAWPRATPSRRRSTRSTMSVAWLSVRSRGRLVDLLVRGGGSSGAWHARPGGFDATTFPCARVFPSAESTTDPVRQQQVGARPFPLHTSAVTKTVRIRNHKYIENNRIFSTFMKVNY